VTGPAGVSQPGNLRGPWCSGREGLRLDGVEERVAGIRRPGLGLAGFHPDEVHILLGERGFAVGIFVEGPACGCTDFCGQRSRKDHAAGVLNQPPGDCGGKPVPLVSDYGVGHGLLPTFLGMHCRPAERWNGGGWESGTRVRADCGDG
jgi:hypothetical protein